MDDLGRGVKLSLALPTLGRKVPHQVFVGVAKYVVVLGAVLREIESWVLEDGDQVGKAVDFFLAFTELYGIVEIRHIGQFVGIRQWGDNLFIDLISDIRFALQRNHVLEARAFRDLDRRVGHASVFVAYVFDEE